MVLQGVDDGVALPHIHDGESAVGRRHQREIHILLRRVGKLLGFRLGADEHQRATLFEEFGYDLAEDVFLAVDER